MSVGPKIVMKLISFGVGIPVGIVTKRAVEGAWSATRGEEPPRKPSDPGVRWVDAIAWAALSAAGIVAAELATRRGAEVVWRRVIGTEPPPPKQSKAQKKLGQAQDKADLEPAQKA
jgi:hypothetical protein